MKSFLPLPLLLLLTFGVITISTGQEDNNAESYLTPQEEEGPENSDIEYLLLPDDDIFSFLDAPHALISESVEEVAQGMDLFFADEKIYSEATTSYARLSTQISFNNDNSTSTYGDIHLKIDLPQTKKKLKLLLESDTDRDLQTGTDQNKSPGQKDEAVSFFAALQKEISERRAWRTKVSLGIKLKVPLDPFILVRAAKDFSIAEWKMRFTETLFWFNSKGAGASSLLELDYALTKDLLFRSRTSELWTDFLDYHEIEQIFSLYHELTERRAISYNIGIYDVTHPSLQTERYYASIGYRQRVHKDWLFIEVSPAVVYARENDFHADHSVILKLEMVFGTKYVYRPTGD